MSASYSQPHLHLFKQSTTSNASLSHHDAKITGKVFGRPGIALLGSVILRAMVAKLAGKFFERSGVALCGLSYFEFGSIKLCWFGMNFIRL
jgi:hypothetical protein